MVRSAKLLFNVVDTSIGVSPGLVEFAFESVTESRRVKETGLHETAVVSVVPITHLVGCETLAHVLSVDQPNLPLVLKACLVETCRRHSFLLHNANVR